MPNAPEPARLPPIGDRPEPADPTDPAADHARGLLGASGLARSFAASPAPACPALEWARSGAMALTGEPEGPPGFAKGGLATAARGAGLALADLAPEAGFEALDAPALLGERAALFGFDRRGRVSCGGSARIVSTADGAIALNLPRDDDWRSLEAWLERPLADAAALRDWNALEAAIAPRQAEPLVERGRELGLALAIAAPSIDSAARPFRLEHETRRSPPVFPPPPLAFARSGAAERGAGLTAIDAPTRIRRRPRVLDLSTLWAGPLAGGLLAQAGFDVVKLESATRPDGARLGVAGFFERLHAGKRGGALDLFAARDREIFTRLLEAADVVLESARPRALAQLGFDADAWVGARPGRIWASITGYGRDREWIAFGDDAAVAAGLAHDPESGAPRFCGDAVADPLTGLYAAVAIASLYAQGRGGLVSLALAEVAAHAAGAGRGAGQILPIRLREGHYGVLERDRWHPIAPPRARVLPYQAATPSSGPLDAALLDDWTRPC